jgi:NTP pyrophosphatase (non-canonical NTP hydrolase)
MLWSNYIVEVVKREGNNYEMLENLGGNTGDAGNGDNYRTPEQFANLRCLHATIGIVGEVGECFEAYTFASANNQGRYDRENMEEELGDIQWYTGLLIDACGSPIDGLQAFDDDFDDNFGPAWKTLRPELQLQYTLMQACKLLDVAKKYFVYGKNDVPIAEVMKYGIESHMNNIYLLHAAFGFNPAQTRNSNCAKLQARYGEGFSNENALNRDVVAEGIAMAEV